MPEEKITFVNGEPAKCGCQMKLSSGGGEYSDVLYVMHCPNHSPKSFGPVEVKRDKDGWWWHPGIPEFHGGEDPAPYRAWVAEQGLEVKGWHSGDETTFLKKMPHALPGIPSHQGPSGSLIQMTARMCSGHAAR